MAHELIAILDAPKSMGMGMHGVLLRDAQGLVTAGLRSNRRVSEREYNDLVEGRHVLEVEGDMPGSLLGDRVADAGVLWVGDEFTERSSNHDIAAPIAPRKGTQRAREGRFWFDLQSINYATTQHWLKNGLRQLVARMDPQLPELMLNVDATSDYTRAAILRTSGDPDRDMRWFDRLDADRGIQRDHAVLRTELNVLLEEATVSDGLVVALVAYAKRGSHELGTQIATSSGVPFTAFREYFHDEADRLFDAHDRRSMVSAGEIVTDYRSPDAIIEGAILGSLRPSVAGVPSVVIDGLRHHHILEALRNVRQVKVELAAIVGPQQLESVGIEETMPSDEIEQSQTEKEIGELTREARFHLPRDRRRVSKALKAAA